MAAIGQSRPLAPTNMRTPLFIFGIALALVAFLVMFAFGIVFVGRTQPTGTIPVVVAKNNIDARASIAPDDLTISSLPASAVPPNAFLHISQLTGYSAIVQIYKGQAISDNLVASNPDQLSASSATAFLAIPPGYVALTLPTSEQQGVAGFISQGDYINVIAAVNTSLFTPRNPRSVARTVFSSLHVIRVGPQSLVQKQGQVQGVSSSVTVVMTQCDANAMDWLLINTTLKYTLLAHQDYDPKPPQPDPSCPSTAAPGSVGPAQIDARWHFTEG
jgi:Flp pilus assembly protein CpaB